MCSTIIITIIFILILLFLSLYWLPEPIEAANNNKTIIIFTPQQLYSTTIFEYSIN